MSTNYYIMKRKAQQVLAVGRNICALLLMDDLRAWWHCPDKSKLIARDIFKAAKRRYRRLTGCQPRS